jgi:hypothetical protein
VATKKADEHTWGRKRLIDRPPMLVTLVWCGTMLVSCSLLPARRALGPTPVPATATPTPGPFLDAAGDGQAFISAIFSAPGGGWMALWTYDCARAGLHWAITMRAVHDRARAQPHAQEILSAAGGGARRPRGRGSATMSIRGTVYAEVHASTGCTWTVRGMPG